MHCSFNKISFLQATDSHSIPLKASQPAMNKLFIYDRNADSCIFFHEWKASAPANQQLGTGKNAAKSAKSIFSITNELDKLNLNSTAKESPVSKSYSIVGDILPSISRTFARSKLSVSEYFASSPSTTSAPLSSSQQWLSTPECEAEEEDADELENKKHLIYGLTYTIEEIVKRMSSSGTDTFLGYKTDNYALHYFVSPTGYRFVLVSDKSSIFFSNGRKLLNSICDGPFLKYVVLNSLQTLNGLVQPENQKFKNALIALLNGKSG